MNKHLLVYLIGWVTFLAGNVAAKEVSLDIGERYRQGNLTVTCANR